MRAPNLSLGYWILTGALQLALRRVGGMGMNPETVVHDRHPKTKKDAPSATALSLAATVETETGKNPLEITFDRQGEPVNDHAVNIFLDGEYLSLKHGVEEIQAMARGAVMAVRWIVKTPPALVTITDVYDELLLRRLG